MTSRLLIFAKHPEPGRCKTRLIPTLGEAGAAELHAVLTARTLSQVARLPGNVSVDVCYTGLDASWFQQQCDEHELAAELLPQVEGDLGARMLAGFGRAFANGMKRVIAIGTDCPQLSAEIICSSLARLEESEIVLGPAADGGYYLLGMTAPVPELFEGIAWGSSSVLEQTLAVLERLSMSVSRLPVLSDIDRPEDLALCRELGLPVPG